MLKNKKENVTKYSFKDIPDDIIEYELLLFLSMKQRYHLSNNKKEKKLPYNLKIHKVVEKDTSLMYFLPNNIPINESICNITFFSGVCESESYDNKGILKCHQKGNIKKGLLNGKSEVTIYGLHGETVQQYSKGMFIKGVLHGLAIITHYKYYPISYGKQRMIQCRRIGMFQNGMMNGQGTRTEYYENGSIKNYKEGMFENGELHGEGEEISYCSKGNIIENYVGSFYEGICFFPPL